VSKRAKKTARATLAQVLTKSPPDDVRLAREDWDFSACPDDQLEACFFYEVARECPHLRGSGAFQRAEPGADLQLEGRCAVTIVDLYKVCPEFPAAPFLTIPKPQRTQRIANLHNATPPVQADLSALIRQCANNPPNSKTIDYGVGVVAAFYIDLRISDEKLAKGFRQWLKKNRPLWAVPMIRKGKGSSREQLRKDLKALGALRLLREVNWEDAYVYTREFLKNNYGQPEGLFGSHKGAWQRARKNAEKTIKEVCGFLERLT
jgi:hypothetical protein